MQSKALKDGDYSVAGYENKFAIERKGMSDLYSYVAAEREKTIKKLERLSQYEFRGLVIDCKESEILRPQEFTRVSPEVVRQALVSFEIRYGMHIYYAGDRDHAARWLLDRAIKYFNIKREA